MKISEQQFELFTRQLRRAAAGSPFYREKFRGFDVESVRTPEDILRIPFSTKEDLRLAYPLGLQAVPDEEIVRIHSSSGTTGTPVIIPYTARDVSDWAEMMMRCFQMAGVTNRDRVQITPGYGLWTAGIGFQAGVERLGAMAIPLGPGNVEKQITMMVDLGSTVITATSSFALLLSEEIGRRGLRDKIKLKRGIIGSERWGDKMRARIASELGIELYDIYGLTEIYGPGISINCRHNCGLHYWDDYLYFEVVDPQTGAPLPDGEVGELVVTTLRKEGAPLIRYRTHDLTRLLTGECPCGSHFPRHDRIVGRTDDMVKIRGVNIFPAQVDNLLRSIPGVSSEYRVTIERPDGRDIVTLAFETESGADKAAVAEVVKGEFKRAIGITVDVQALSLGGLPRSEKKTKRIIDNRQN